MDGRATGAGASGVCADATIRPVSVNHDRTAASPLPGGERAAEGRVRGPGAGPVSLSPHPPRCRSATSPRRGEVKGSLTGRGEVKEGPATRGGAKAARGEEPAPPSYPQTFFVAPPSTRIFEPVM